MLTCVFIGSDKNAGKTTALNFVYQKLAAPGAIAITSVGINGEDIDNYEGQKKPEVRLKNSTWFITAGEHLKNLYGKYRTNLVLSAPTFSKDYVCGQLITDASLVIEGPNKKAEIMCMQALLKQTLNLNYLLIDGSIDRQFLATPEISDRIYFALLASPRLPQRQKAQKILDALNLPKCQDTLAAFIERQLTADTRSLIFTSQNTVLYRGIGTPFADEKLLQVISAAQQPKIYFYLAGALTSALAQQVARLKNLHIIIDNFSLVQDFSFTQENYTKKFTIEVLNKPMLAAVFVKEEHNIHNLTLPVHIPVFNIFHEDFDEIRI